MPQQLSPPITRSFWAEAWDEAFDMHQEYAGSTPDTSRCELCERAVERLTVHHLVPRSTVRRRDRSTLPTAKLCGACHRQLHVLFSNRDLKAQYSGIDELRSAPEMQKFLRWIIRQDPNKHIRVRRG